MSPGPPVGRQTCGITATLTTFTRKIARRALETSGDLVRHFVRAFRAGAPPNRRLDPRVTTVPGRIRDADNLRMSLETDAALVHLSPGRFAHLFRDQLGLSFRRFMLLRKLTRAMLAIGRRCSMADAAHG